MGKYRILVIDDDEDARRLIGMALRPRYEVVESCDGLDALSRLDQIEPDLAIIDIMMPMMDGYQVCEAIRRNPRFQSMQVMFLSAYGTKDNIKKGYAAGANLFLTKPVDPERLLKNIDLSIAHEPPPVRPKRHTLADLERMGAGQESEKDGHPAEPPERAAVTPPPPSPTPAKFPQHPIPSTLPEVRPRILMVDDDEEMLKMLDLALRDDFETVTAVNGMEAIERMVEYQPDLLLIDIMMPKMNGYQLLQSVRRNAYFGTMPIVVLSAKSTPRDQEYAAKMGATLFLPKPYHVEDLLKVLHHLTKAPNFRIRPKRISDFEIKERAMDVIRKHEEHEQQAILREVFTEPEKDERQRKPKW